MKAAVAGVLRERRRHAATRDGAGGQDAVEAEVISLLYGDAAVRHRTFDTQPSHIWHPPAESRSAAGRK
jgi:hypothetical protein